MSHDMTLLGDGCSQMGLVLDDAKADQFGQYLSMLVEWNEKFNLTAITDPRDIIIQHFLDSISVLGLGFMTDGMSILDMGTGAGFPGIPIKIMLPDTKLVLVDAVQKKTVFLSEVVKELKLNDVEVIHGRVEDLGREAGRREAFDAVVSRAVAELRVLLEYCFPFIRTGGYFAAYKGPAAAEESKNALNALKVLGGDTMSMEKVEVPYSDRTHILVTAKKIKQTPKQYPRSAGKPKKSPL